MIYGCPFIAKGHDSQHMTHLENKDLGIWYELFKTRWDYRKTSNIRRTLGGNKIVDHSDVVGASPVGAAPTTSSFST